MFFWKVLKNKLGCRVQLLVAENMSECCKLSFYLLNWTGEGKFVDGFVPVVNLEFKAVYVADVTGCQPGIASEVCHLSLLSIAAVIC